METAIIISVSSDIGCAIAHRWRTGGARIFGTYRTYSDKVDSLIKRGVEVVSCDLAKRESILDACSALRERCPQWDVLVVCAGSQAPIGALVNTDFDKWEESVMVNFIGQVHVVHELLPTRHRDSAIEPTVVFFAGGGPNKATVNYSAYAVSKVALIKMCELLDAEVPDTRFVIVNPGWVKTKIHDAVLKAGPQAGDDYWRTVDKFNRSVWTPIERVVECCDWLIQAPRNLASGRYFGVEFDAWGSEKLNRRLAADPDMFKLRRYE